MASFSADGIDDIVKALTSADLFDEDSQKEILAAGVEHLADQIREEIARAPYNLKFVSDKLSTSSKKLKKDKDGNYYMVVTIKGKNARGERNAAVAFVLNYGRREKYGKITGSYFWTRAVQRAEKTVVPVYENVVTELYQEKGLI